MYCNITIVALGKKTIIITYSECVFVALVIQHAKRMRHTAICVLSGCTIFLPLYLINGTTFGKNVAEHKTATFVPNIAHSKQKR